MTCTVSIYSYHPCAMPIASSAPKRGRRLGIKIMSPQLVEKVVSEVSIDLELRTVRSFQCGEKGESFLNSHALECMKIIRETLTKCIISVFTNFSLLTREKSVAIIGEGAR